MKKKLGFWVFVLPTLIPFIIVVLIPAAMGLYYSLTDWNGVGTSANFVGLENFKYIFTKDPDFVVSFVRTIFFSLVCIIVINVIAFLLALLVTQKIKGSNFMRSAFFVPNLIGGLLLGFIWKFIFTQVFDAFGKSIGVRFLKGWLSTPTTAMVALVIVVTWQLAGYMMLIYIAQLQNISDSVLEASLIDGANGWHRLKSIILPLCRPAFTTCLFLTISNTFKLYDQNLSLTGGGPYGKSELVALNIYNTAFNYSFMGRAQAKAIIFLIVIIIVSVTQLSISKRGEVEL